jgi:hypothetical protein
MVPHMLGQMLWHLAVRLVSTAGLVDMLKLDKSSDYDLLLVSQNDRTIIANAMLLGVGFGALAIWLVISIKSGTSVLVTAAGVLISLGLVQQIMSIALDAVTTSINRYISTWNSVIYSLAKKRKTKEWSEVQDEAEEIFIFPEIYFSLPKGITKDSDESHLVRFIAEHRWEISFPQANFYIDEKSLISFARYGIDSLRQRLTSYDRLSTMQHRTGTVNPVLFVALGTLIWLLS